MKKLIYLLSIFLLFSCSEQDNSEMSIPENSLNLKTLYNAKSVYNFAGSKTINGVDSDGEHLWLLYFERIGGYYDNNELTLVKYDYKNQKTLTSLTFNDEHIVPSGITFDGENIWMQFDDKVKLIDISEGKEIKTFVNEYGANDIIYNDNKLYITLYYHYILELNPTDGSIIRKLDDPLTNGKNDLASIDFYKDEIWLKKHFRNDLVVLNENFEPKGLVNIDSEIDTERSKISFNKNNQLIINTGSRIYICDIEKI